VKELSDIKQALADNAAALALDLFGQPTSSTSQQYRWGRNSSTLVNIGGRWRGRFKSWETDESGSMLDAIMFAYGIAFSGAVDCAREWLGDEDRHVFQPRQRPPVIDVDAEEIKRRDRAIQQWTSSIPIAGTTSNSTSIAEKYLNSRGIHGPWPSSVRYDPSRNAAIFASTAPDGRITAIQRVYLNPDGSPKLEDGKKIKRSLGPRYKGAVRLEGDQRALCLAEGPETGLSVSYATGIETWVGLGQIASISLENVPASRTIIVCKDDDPRMAPGRKALRNAIKRWRKEGRTVLEVLPHERSRGDKSDFNDALIHDGREAVSRRITSVLETKRPDTTAGQPVQWARQALATETSEAISQLWARRDEETPPALALKASLGLGKTARSIFESDAWVNDGRGNVVYAVPYHRLGRQIQQRIQNEAGPTIEVAVWRGRESDDPDADGEKMCRDIDAVQQVLSVAGDPQTQVCISGDRKCAFADVCGYQKQRKKTGQIWIVAHHSLFAQKPEAIPSPTLVIIDESFHGAGLRGTTGHPVMVSQYQVERAVSVTGNISRTADLMTELMPTRKKLEEIIGQHDLGPLSRQALIESGLTADECSAAATLEWKRKVEPSIWPGMPAEDRKKAIKVVQENSEVPRMALMWKLLAEVLEDESIDLSGRLRISEQEDKGATYKGLQLIWHDEIKEGWKAPTLHIDGTLELDLVRLYLPGIEMRADIRASAQHQHLTQYPSHSFSKASLKSPKTVDDVWYWCLVKARQVGGQWLIVIPKDAEESIRERHTVPNFISLAHHNSIAGRDEWKDIRGLIVISRTQPPVDGVQRIAGALSGRHTEISTEQDGYYSQRSTTLTDANGSTITVDVDTAGDGLAETIRRSICENQVEQIIARARGVNRTADNPVEIHALTNVPLEQRVDQIGEYQSPSIDDELFAISGVWLSSVGDMAKVHGLNRNTLKSGRQRMGAIPYKNIYYETAPNLRTVNYQVSGAGRTQQTAVFDTTAIDDIDAWLTERLGELKYCRPSGYEPDVRPSHAVGAAGIEPAIAVATTATAIRIQEVEVAPLLEDEDGGLLSDEVAGAARALMRDANLTQDELAGMIGISRSQLTNALQSRYGLSAEPYAALLRFISNPPPIRQMSFSLK
jgi:putative DNA primase/helicase